mmetsp:Transcript_89601/g.255936  ORF Transcript_89601/g.255936 Transcript_89601/m.255936 type:complete len:310 (-) Transcript_89601:309-1238(-)|eukprot:CAMPEP_0119480422 /NCGR_PEP_ID=MMETSP1344-20130328/9233_1 /TAXON_ID=236787 /ORGANISM="Florenciella parvula, Strain CCMP2471" /LENGTH=309 /DNA_ID=CAMNT_0007514729 /DNA_START=151 /DNA_END=1080 /DNA_ORIENTATION=-
MVSVDAGQSEPSYFDSVWAEFAAFSESFTLPAELPSESWFSFSWWDPWASDEETSSTSTAAKETAASDALCAAKRSRSPPGSPRSGRKRNLRVRSSASCSPAMMSNSTLCRAKMGETTSQLPHINESNAMPSPFARKTTRRRSASQRPASTTGDDDDHILDLEPLSLFSSRQEMDDSPNSTHEFPPLPLFSVESSKSVVVHSVEFVPGFNPGEKPCIRVELNGEDANQSAHDLEWCGQESEWSVEHRFEFPVCEGENVFVSFALHDGHDNDDELASVSIKPGPLTSREVYEMHDERGDLAGRIKVSVML